MDKASRPHRHSYFQLIWFKSPGQHYIDYEVVEHPAHTCFMINKHQVHYFCPQSANEGYLFHFNDIFVVQHAPKLLERISMSVFSEMLSNHLMLDETQVTRMETLTRMIIEETRARSPLYGEAAFHLFATLLIGLERQLQTQGKSGLMNESFVLAARFKKLVIEHIDQFWSVEEIARQLNTNSKALSKATKEALSQTPGKIVAQLKILEAKRKLSNPTLSIKAIGRELGFDQATYFTKYFKKETGLTPKEFQQSLP